MGRKTHNKVGANRFDDFKPTPRSVSGAHKTCGTYPERGAFHRFFRLYGEWRGRSVQQVSAATARMALTQLPVTSCPKERVANCAPRSSASSTAVRVIQRIRRFTVRSPCAENCTPAAAWATRRRLCSLRLCAPAQRPPHGQGSACRR